MKGKNRLILVASILGIIAFSGASAKQPVIAENARVFVQKFYDWYSVLYLKPVNKKNPVTPDVIAINQHQEYFDGSLRKALLDDALAQSKSRDEIVGLDFDPFLGGQDIAKGYQTGNVKQVGNSFLVDIHNIRSGQSRSVVLASEKLVTAKVANINGQWVFTDFIYPTGSGKYNLARVLMSLKSERDKTGKQ